MCECGVRLKRVPNVAASATDWRCSRASFVLDGFWWTVGVIIGNKDDLAAGDPTLGVNLAEIGCLGPADNAVGRCGPAVRHDVADLDLGVGYTGIVFFLGKCAAFAGSKQNDGGRKRRQSSCDEGHLVSP